MRNRIIDILSKKNFLHISDVLGHERRILSGFRDVYFDANQKEVYILVEKNESFSVEEIIEFETQISGFITIFADEVLAYNTNLILISPLGFYNSSSDIEKNDYMDLVNRYERDKFYCRKIFLDKSAQGKYEESELSILPFVDISFESIPCEQNDDEAELNQIFENKIDIFLELIKDNHESCLANIEKMFEIYETKGEEHE